LVSKQAKLHGLQRHTEWLTAVNAKQSNDLIELRDYRLLVQEYKKVRLDKLQSDLAAATDGTTLRAILRDMIRQGGKDLVSRLCATELPLEPWMMQALVNMAHIEAKTEEVEAKLFEVRQAVFAQGKDGMESMMSRSNEARFDLLCAQTWHVAEEIRDKASSTSVPWGSSRQKECSGSTSLPVLSSPKQQLVNSQRPVADIRSYEKHSALDTLLTASPTAILSERRDDIHTTQFGARGATRALEKQVTNLTKMLQDIRQNVAAVVSNRMDQAQRMERLDAKEVNDWGQAVLHLMISDDYANATMKQLKKLAFKEELFG
jgi:hypothetical protein